MEFNIYSRASRFPSSAHATYLDARRTLGKREQILVMDEGNEFTLNHEHVDHLCGYGTPEQREPTPAEVRRGFYMGRE